MSGIDLSKIIGKMVGKIRSEEKESIEVEEENDESPKNPTPIATLPVPAAPKTKYLKALVLHSLENLAKAKSEVESGNIVIVKVGPLAKTSLEEAKLAVNELCEFAVKTGGDIARLGEERIVLTPSSIKIWREKTSNAQTEGSI